VTARAVTAWQIMLAVSQSVVPAQEFHVQAICPCQPSLRDFRYAAAGVVAGEERQLHTACVEHCSRGVVGQPVAQAMQQADQEDVQHEVRQMKERVAELSALLSEDLKSKRDRHMDTAGMNCTVQESCSTAPSYTMCLHHVGAHIHIHIHDDVPGCTQGSL